RRLCAARRRGDPSAGRYHTASLEGKVAPAAATPLAARGGGGGESGASAPPMEEILRQRGRRRGWRCTLLSSRFPGGAREERKEGYRIVRDGGEYTFHVAPPRLYRRRAGGAQGGLRHGAGGGRVPLPRPRPAPVPARRGRRSSRRGARRREQDP